MPSKLSAQGATPDPRNESVLVSVNGHLLHRDQAMVSVFDSGFVCGDGIWEGMRLVNGKLIAIEEHLDRLFAGACAIDLDIGITRAEIEERIWSTLRANGMLVNGYARLMVTRGVKSTPNQDPRSVTGKATIVIVAEHKAANPELKESGIALFTSAFRCSPPDVFDLRLNSHSRLNLIQALIQAIHAGADEALMLDPNGFVASCNSTNFFVVRDGSVWTSSGRYNFNGITRKTVLRLAAKAGIPTFTGDFTLAEVYSANESFATGTFGGITPVVRVDGRTIGTGRPGPMTRQLSELYDAYVNA